MNLIDCLVESVAKKIEIFTIISDAGVYALMVLYRSSSTQRTPNQNEMAQQPRNKTRVMPSEILDEIPLLFDACLAGSRCFLYRSTSIFSPPNANTVRTAPKTSSTTLAALEYASNSLLFAFA